MIKRDEAEPHGQDEHPRTVRNGSADNWELARRELRALGVSLPGGSDDVAAAIIAPAHLDVLRRATPPSRFVAAWRATARRGAGAPEVWTAVLMAFKNAFARTDRAVLEQALASAGMGYARTDLEIDLQLAGQLFLLGRRELNARKSDTALRLLEKALALFDSVAARDAALKAHVRRGLRGMHGITALLIGRHDEQPGPLLRTAVEQLVKAEALGDRTPDHYTYLLEALLRLHQLEDSPETLTKAEATWAQASTGDLTRGLLAVGAELGQVQARRAEEASDGARHVRALAYAESLLSQALDRHPGPSSVDDGFLHAVRARVRHQLFTHDTDDEGRRKPHWLDLALDDTRYSSAKVHLSASVEVGILLDGARRLQRRGNHEGAMEILDAALDRLERMPEDDPTAQQVMAARLDSEIFLAIRAGDRAAVRSHLETALQLPEGVRVPAAATSVASRMLLRGEPNDADVRALAERTLASLVEDVTTQSATLPARRHIAGHAARLAWILIRGSSDKARLRQVGRLFRVALETPTGPPSPMLLADAGACALQLAKEEIDSGSPDTHEALGHLTDASQWLTAAIRRWNEVRYDIDETFEAGRVAARAGEVFARLHAMTGDDANLSCSIDWLNEARTLGYPWTRLRGHLADALYRRGRSRSDPEDLREAIHLKDEDHLAGSTARENRSVAASAALALFELEGAETDLERAATLALEAATLDPLWPWPVLQLAEVFRVAQRRKVALRQGIHDTAVGDLVHGGDVGELERHAARLAASSPEFAPQSMGGQARGGRAVYVLADPHRLLERTLVLKRLPQDVAQREADATRRFASYLAETSSPSSWTVPDSLGVIPHPTDPRMAVYVMRRAQGPTLGQLVQGDLPLGEVQQLVFAAAEFLAAHSAWAHHEMHLPASLAEKRIKRLAEGLFGRARGHGVGSTAAQRLMSGLAAVLRGNRLAVVKRDAHADNWLVSADGSIVALDLETTTTVPILWEIAQLVDDWPFFPADVAGWQQRISVARAYLNELGRRGLEVVMHDDEIERCLTWFSIAHAAAAASRLAEHPDDWRASASALTARRLRRAHVLALLTFIADVSPERAARMGASSLVAALAKGPSRGP